jgi:hypothetical protein
MDYMKDSDPGDGVASDSDDNAYINIDIDTEEHIDTDEIDSDKFSDTKIDTNNNLNLKSDIFSVIDDEYFTDNEKIRIIF